MYKRGKDNVLMRCVDASEAKRIIEEVHDGVCGAHSNGHMMARQIMRAGYYWLTMEHDCIKYAKNAINVRFMQIKFIRRQQHCTY